MTSWDKVECHREKAGKERHHREVGSKVEPRKVAILNNKF
jgi:hypothetical protein